MRSLVESLAQMLVDLGHVSRSQWALRLLAVVALAAAQLVATGGGLFSALLPGVTSLAVIVFGLLQSLRPDGPWGLPALAAPVLAAAGTAPGGAGVLALIGCLLLLAHACWSTAAMVPAHGVITRGAALRCAAWAGAAVLLGGGLWLLVLPLAGARTPEWTLVLGTLALIVLVLVLVPRGTPRRRGR